MERFLDANFRKYPGNATHVVVDGELFVLVDTTMTADKEGILALEHAETGQASSLQFSAGDKLPVPIYDYSVRMGISRSGSNPPRVDHLFDGRQDTYWEPDPNDSIDSWWLEIDLGRSVLVDEIVLRFDDAEVGDPFRQFKILASPGQDLLEDEQDEIEFAVVGGTRVPNEGKRVEHLMAGQNGKVRINSGYIFSPAPMVVMPFSG